MWHPTRGTVVASLHVDESGHGKYQITATNLERSGNLHVIGWDGEWLDASAEGARQRLRAILQAGILYVELPVVGQVKLFRQSPQHGPVDFRGS